ncbi:hypothetical protein HZB94_01750 [Candidatus Falkowbacteria bacterium]|nr:hypothetical protein [Candidatus Falkowbacteria bacterium]
MNIQFPEHLNHLVAEAAQKLSTENATAVALPKPWSGFQVTFIAPDGNSAFKVFSPKDLSLPQETRQIFLICNDLLGGANSG